NDVDNFDWNLLGKDFDDDDDEENENKENKAFLHNFEIKKSREQKEDFELFEGFNLPLPTPNLQSSYSAKCLDRLSLYPLVVESVSNQTLLTRKMKAVTTAPDKNSLKIFDSLTRFQEYFKQKLEIQKFALSIDRNNMTFIDRNNMTFQEFRVLVEDGINIPNIFKQYETELKDLEDKINNFFDKALEKKRNVIKQIAYQILRKTYNGFESLIGDYDKNQVEEETISINEIDPNIILRLKNEIFNISTTTWKSLKTRLILAKKCDLVNSISKVFCDEEQDFPKLIKKYKSVFERCLFCVFNGKGLHFNELTRKIIDKINDEVKTVSDSEFVKQIFKLNNEMITSKFVNAYQEWRNNFDQSINRVIQDFREEVEKSVEIEFDKFHKRSIKECERDYFELICGKIEAKYLADYYLTQMENRLTLTILNLKIDEHKKRYSLTCEVSEKLCFTIYNLNLDQSDIERMDKDESFIPTPRISNPITSFNIDPETYEFIEIAQLGKKYLLFLWNMINEKLDIYFEVIKNLPEKLDSQSPLKKLTLGRNFMIAINVSKSLIAIYENDKGILNTYGLNKEQDNIHLQYRNIQISQWYNLNIPEIAHFFFIKNTEDVCFVEKNGQARIYSLINGNFRPGAAHLPKNCTKVISAPDGTCFVAFVKEKLAIEASKFEDKVMETNSKNFAKKMQDDIFEINDKSESSSTNDTTGLSSINIAIISQRNIDSSTESELSKDVETYKKNTDNLTEFKLRQDTTFQPKINNSQVLTRDIVRGYVFFLEKFSKNANKIIDVPFSYPTIELFQFASLTSKHNHLMAINQHNNSLQSLL
ncbi:32109_t:CDS:2, partial [Racocetra persica]